MEKGNLDYRLLFEQSNEGMLVLTAGGDVLDANLEARKILKRRREDLVAEGRDGVFDPTDPRSEPAFEEFERTGRFEGKLRLLRRHGAPFLAEVTMTALEEGLMNVSFRNASRLERAEEEVCRTDEDLEDLVAERTAQLEATVSKLVESERMLRESEERFRITFEQARVGIAHVAPDGRWLRVNQKLCETVGYEREELLEKTFQEITHPNDLNADLEHVRRLMVGEIDEYSMEKRYFRKDGSVIWIELGVSLVREPSGEPSYFISVVEDIDERKRRELLLRSLTPREVEVLRLLTQGFTNSEIARSLNFSMSTIKSHVRHLVTKLEASNRVGAAARAVKLGLIEQREFLTEDSTSLRLAG